MINDQTQVTIDESCLSGDSWCFVVTRTHDGTVTISPPDYCDSSFQEAPVQATFGEVLAIDRSLEGVRDLEEGWTAWRQSPTEPWERKPIPTGPTFYIGIEARPAEDNPDHGVLGPAYVACWVRCATREEAERHARDEVVASRFEVVSIDESQAVVGDDYRDDPDLEYFEQAQIDGHVSVFYSSPRYPVFLVRYSLEAAEAHGEDVPRSGSLWVSNELIGGEDADPYDPDFWSEARVEDIKQEAVRRFQEAGWRASDLLEATRVSFEMVEDDEANLQSFEEAEERGSCVVFTFDWDAPPLVGLDSG